MRDNRRERWTLLGLLVGGAIVLLTGINWGLPSRDVDRFLFGSHPVWTGQEIAALLPPARDDNRAADRDANPIGDRTRAIVVNATDAQRAEIVARYRLYSYQPDEMHTFRSLARMRPSQGDFDPRFYQYGSLWVYPVGVLLKIASVLGLVTVKSDLSYYFDHPEQFARFYIGARLYSAAWAIAGIWVVHRLVRKFGGSFAAASVASACYIVMPVVVNMAHEAKPHMPAVVLMLMAVLAAIWYVQRGDLRSCLLMGAVCGAAAGMVLTAAPIFAVIVVAAWMRRRVRDGVIAGGLGIAVYCVTNPYLPINLLFHRELLQSNVGNYANFYRVSFGGVINGVKLIAEGTSPILAIAGLVGCASLWIRARQREWRQSTGLLLAVPALLIFVQFVLLGEGKPGEYGRFGLFPDIALCIAAASVLDMQPPHQRRRVAVLLILLTAPFGLRYLYAFVRDSRSVTGRLEYAQTIDDLKRAGRKRLGIVAEPAPYCLPPVDLFAWELVLLPKDSNPADADADVVARAVDAPSSRSGGALNRIAPARISWADKPFEIRPGDNENRIQHP